jgi:SulP family sulfate permease
MAFPGLVSYIAMPALGALLILAGFTSLNPRDVRSVWHAGWPSRLAAGSTFLAALFLSIQLAVGIGVLLSALLYVSRASTDVSLVELVERPDGRIEEWEPPKRLPSNAVTVLDVYGHLFYAGAQTLERLLPMPQSSRKPAVVLRLRGLTTAGVTLQDVLANYADKLAEVDGQLYLTGISERVHDQVVRTGKLRLSGPVQVYDATPIRGQSTRQAVDDARTWLVGASTDVEPSDRQR